MLRSCDFKGCDTRTLGSFCVQHEATVNPASLARGRPFQGEGCYDHPKNAATDLIDPTVQPGDAAQLRLF